MPRKSPWNGPTKAIRVPEHCADDLVAIAKLLDCPHGPDWYEFDELVREIKRTKHEQDLKAAGIPVCRPKTDPETIAQGLSEGWIKPKPDRAALPMWDERLATKPQALAKLNTFHGLTESLVRAIKFRSKPPTEDDYQQFVVSLWDLVNRYKEASYRLFCERIGQTPNTQLGKVPTCPLLAGYEVGDHAVLHGNPGQLVVSHGPGEGDRKVVHVSDCGHIRTVFNQRAAADIQPLEAA
jgi:hypothetical protein